MTVLNMFCQHCLFYIKIHRQVNLVGCYDLKRFGSEQKDVGDRINTTQIISGKL